MRNDSLRQTALAYFQAIGRADADSFAALFSADAHFEDPVAGPAPALIGEEGVRRFHKGLRRAWQSLRMDVDDVFVRGSRAAVRWHATGLSTTGKDIDFEGINIVTFDEAGRISRLEGYWDFEGVIAQM
jgi:steroid delta-isomerase-like uncharacterized protein